MSTKRYILILLALVAVALQAQTSDSTQTVVNKLQDMFNVWGYGTVYHYKTFDNKYLTGYDLNKIITVPMGKYTLEADNRFFYTDRFQEEKQERLDERLQLALWRSWAHCHGNVFYRGEYFNKNDARYFYPAFDTLFYEKEGVHRTYNQQIGFNSKYDLGKLNAELNARHRTFFYHNKQTYPDTVNNIRQFNNLIAGAKVSYRVIDPVSIYVDASMRNFLNGPNDVYDYTTGGVGLQVNWAINHGNHITGYSAIDWLNGDQFSLDKFIINDFEVKLQDTQRMIPINTELRYNSMLGIQTMGYFSVACRNFYDRGAKEFLLNSYFLRASLKHTWTYDLTEASYTEIGGKYSPETNVLHKNSVMFIKGDWNVINRLYLGGQINHMPTRIDRYEASGGYFFSRWNEVLLTYIYSNDREQKMNNSYTGLGLRMMF